MMNCQVVLHNIIFWKDDHVIQQQKVEPNNQVSLVSL